MTVRSGEATPDSVTALWKDGLAERIEVHPLSSSESDELVVAGLRGQVDGGTLRGLWQLTQGNPLFLRELVLGGLETGALHNDGGVWCWEGAMTAAPALIELVEARLERVDSNERGLLELLAFGEPLGGTAEQMVSPSVIEAADEKGLVSVGEAGRRIEVRPAHPLYADVVRAQVSTLRARRICAHLADSIEATGARRRDDLLRIATWRLDSAVASPHTQLTLAARNALALFDYDLAERLARAAADAGGGREAEYTLGEAIAGAGRPAEGKEVLDGLSPHEMTGLERTQLAITRSWRAIDR